MKLTIATTSIKQSYSKRHPCISIFCLFLTVYFIHFSCLSGPLYIFYYSMTCCTLNPLFHRLSLTSYVYFVSLFIVHFVHSCPSSLWSLASLFTSYCVHSCLFPLFTLYTVQLRDRSTGEPSTIPVMLLMDLQYVWLGHNQVAILTTCILHSQMILYNCFLFLGWDFFGVAFVKSTWRSSNNTRESGWSNNCLHTEGLHSATFSYRRCGIPLAQFPCHHRHLKGPYSLLAVIRWSA